MTTHNDWLKRWVDRWVTDANEEIQRRQTAIAELRQALAGTTDESERAWYKSLIEEYEVNIDRIRDSHRQWQRRVKSDWNLNMPELLEGSA